MKTRSLFNLGAIICILFPGFPFLCSVLGPRPQRWALQEANARWAAVVRGDYKPED